MGLSKTARSNFNAVRYCCPWSDYRSYCCISAASKRCCKSVSCKFGYTSPRYTFIISCFTVKHCLIIFLPSLETKPTDTYNIRYNEEEIDFVLPKSLMIHKPSMWYNTLMSSAVTLDNIWLATIAGINYS